LLPLIVAFLLFGSGAFFQDSTVQESPESILGHRIALSLSGSDLSDISADQFEKASNNGIDFLHITHSNQLNGIPVDLFYLIYQSPRQYPALYQLEEQSPKLISQIMSEVQSLSDRFPGKLTSVGLFSFPNEKHSRFDRRTSEIADSLKQLTEIPLFYQSVLPASSLPQDIDFIVRTDFDSDPVQGHNAIYFQPSTSLSESLTRLENLFKETLAFNESLLIIPADWYFNQIAQNPDLELIVSSYRNSEIIPFPIPHRAESPPVMNWNVIFLFVIFGSIIIHARLQPAYLPSLSRYFFNHSFYLQDVLEHRIRNIIPGLVILLQHALSTGVIFYLSAEMLFNRIGLEVLNHNFSSVLWTGNPYLSLFIFGFTFAFTLQAISVFWLHLPNKSLQYLSQTLNLYTWPLHINFLVVAIYIVIYGNDPGDALIAYLLAAYLFVWFMSFNIAALDASKYLEKLNLVYLTVTVGLHILLFASLFWAAFNFPAIYEPVQMALTLSGH